MDINIIIKDHIIPIPRFHMMKKKVKFTKTWKNSITKAKKMLKTRRKQYTYQMFNDVVLTKECHSFHIDKYLVL